MSDGFSNKPRKLRGAFVEYGLSLPPLIVPFQFNPEQLTRSRNLTYQGEDVEIDTAPIEGETEESRNLRQMRRQQSLRDTHKNKDDLLEVRDSQQVAVQEESINFELRLDASDELNDGDIIAGYAGVGPRLSTLELMVTPKEDSVLGAALESAVSGLLSGTGFSFSQRDKPPVILFIWGPTRVLPVNINSMSITETEFNTLLSPVRATVSVNMTVIEGENPLYKYTTGAKEVLSLLNLANITDIADVVVPG